MTLVLEPEMVKRKRNQQLGEIVRGEGPKLFNFIKSRMPNLEDAEDVLQDVLSDFSQTFLFTDSIEQTTGWLYRVAKNRIADTFRRKKTESFSSIYVEEEERWLDDVMLDEQSPEDELWNETLADAINEALSELPEPQRDVFIWHEIEGYSFKEMESITGTSVATLTSRKRYAVNALQKQLNYLYKELTD